MTYHRIAVCVVLFTIAVAVLWDAAAIALGSRETFCHATRQINEASNGLVAMFSIALWFHLFFLEFLPASWTEFPP